MWLVRTISFSYSGTFITFIIFMEENINFNLSGTFINLNSWKYIFNMINWYGANTHIRDWLEDKAIHFMAEILGKLTLQQLMKKVDRRI